MFELSDQKRKLLVTEGSLLVLGGPGSGKTTIALLKAKRIIESGIIKKGQNILFLSFARATVSRVEEQAGLMISGIVKKQLEINTYHGFIWNLLRCHGYLLNSKTPIRLLPPPEAASRLSNIVGKQEREMEKERIFREEGILHFDLFAKMGAQLLTRSNALVGIMSDAYPVIILDEFQDTNKDEWDFIQSIGKGSRLIALADADQRIYEFRGADSARIGEFITEFHPIQFDFGIENNRSQDTDIIEFGNDLLSGSNVGKYYKNVNFLLYPYQRPGFQHNSIKISILKARRHLINNGPKNWSLAVLVPTKRLMLDVSKYLDAIQTLSNGAVLPRINHEVALDTEGSSLAATLIAGLLESGSQCSQDSNQLILDLCEHIRGRKGNDPPSKNHFEFSSALIDYTRTGKIRGKNRQKVVEECGEIVAKCSELNFTGDPDKDWLKIRDILSVFSSEFIKQVEEDAYYLRLLHKGSLLRSSLSNLWRSTGSYAGARESVRDALLQEYFASSTKVWKGIQVMSIHKSKGKEFDEVFVYEGFYQGKIVRRDASQKEISQARLNLRVAVTRARENTTIVTPEKDICMLLR